MTQRNISLKYVYPDFTMAQQKAKWPCLACFTFLFSSLCKAKTNVHVCLCGIVLHIMFGDFAFLPNEIRAPWQKNECALRLHKQMCSSLSGLFFPVVWCNAGGAAQSRANRALRETGVISSGSWHWFGATQEARGAAGGTLTWIRW